MTKYQYHRLNDKLDLVLRLLIHVLNKENLLMATLQDVTAAVAAESTVDDSIIVLLNGIVQQLKDAMASNDPAALDVVVANIQLNTAKIQAAVTANTTPTVIAVPFTKQKNGKYKSPSGRTFSKKQVVAYYATNGFKKKVKK